jgi:hypothetical protein
MTNTKNPFQKLSGYSNNHDFPIIGYGITIETLQSFLFEHNINTDFKIKNSENPELEPDYDDLVDACQKNQNLIEYTAFSNVDGEVLIHYAKIYAVNPEEKLRSRDELDDALLTAANSLFEIPNDEKVQAELKSFIKDYADDIFICDFS